MVWRALVVISTVAAVAVPSAARANGRYPAAISVHFRPGSTGDIVVGATWGMLVTSDGGATWRWSCEEAVGYGGTFDPDYVVSAAGRIFATTAAEGLRFTDDGCTWSATQFDVNLVSSVTVAPNGDVWAAGHTMLEHRIFRSVDNGEHFTAVALTGDDDGAWWESVEVAPSDPNVVYLSGYGVDGNSRRFHLFRSDDAGRSWLRLPVAAFTLEGRAPLLQVAAISPDTFSLLFARLSSQLGTKIYRSTDAGVNWALVLELDDASPGLVVRKVVGGDDPTTTAEVLVGTPSMGTYRSTDGGRSFAKLGQSLQVNCMAERPGDRTIFACANNLAPDNMALARSSDGIDWTAALEFRNVTAPIACGVGTEQRDYCQEEKWCGFKDQLGIVSEVIACAAAVDAGAPDAASGADDGGGGCCDGGAGGGGWLTALALVLGSAAARRRARRI